MATSTEPAAGGLLDLEKELVCFICTEMLYQPLTLIDCLHTFCGSCLKEWFSYQHKKVIQQRSSHSTNPYTCPTCRATVKDARHNATVSTLLDMFLTANPDRRKSAEEKAETARTYKPGDSVLPKIEKRQDRRTRRTEEAAEEADRRQIEEARERSLRDLRGRGANQTSANLHAPASQIEDGSRSRERRDRERRERRRERHDARLTEANLTSVQRHPPGSEDEDFTIPTAASSLALPPLPPRHPQSVEARRSERQVAHQASLRSLVSASESGTGTGDSLDEARIMQEILSGNLLEGINLHDLNAEQEDQLSERIAEAYRQRHLRRGHDSPQQVSRTTSGEHAPATDSLAVRHREHVAVSEPRARSRSAQGHSRVHSRSSAETTTERSPPAPRPHASETAANLSPPETTSAHMRRASDQDRQHTPSSTRNARVRSDHSAHSNPATRSATDITNRAQTADGPRSSQIRHLSDTERSQTVLDQPDPPSRDFQNRPMDINRDHVERIERVETPTAASPALAAIPVAGADVVRPGHRFAQDAPVPVPPSIPVSQPVIAGPVLNETRPAKNLAAEATESLLVEPIVSCARCSRPNIQYELHKHCSRCSVDLCLNCYRLGRGCDHWFGFGNSAFAKFDTSHPPTRGSDLIEWPHRLVGRRYRRPKSIRQIQNHNISPQNNRENGTTPSSRLEEGMFCDRCHSFADSCFWSCEYCNEGEWGFCNKCINSHHECTHPLLPLSHRGNAPRLLRAPRSPQPRAATLGPDATQIHIAPSAPHSRPSSSGSIGTDTADIYAEYRPLVINTSCDICTVRIEASESRFHCPAHITPTPSDPKNRGDYDICQNCYHNLVQVGNIKQEDGPGGWRKCPLGHRMIMVEFDDTPEGHRRIVTNDLVGGHKFSEEDVRAYTAATISPSSRVDLNEALPAAGGRWTWKESSDGPRATRARALTTNPQGNKFPPDGGYGRPYIGLWSYYPEEGDAGKDELLFPKGAEIREVEEINEEWYFGVYAGDKGVLPAQIVAPPAHSSPQYGDFRFRRVKCDETRPICQRCQCTGRKCDGYPPLRPRARRNASGVPLAPERGELIVFGVPRASCPPRKDALAGSLSTRSSWQESEWRGVQFYHERTASGLKAFGAAEAFWNELVPQESETYPTVRHMVVAISALQDSLDKLHLDDHYAGPREKQSLTQCNLAIKSLVRSDAKPPMEVFLSTCVLLIWFELLRCNPRACSIYLELGLSMLNHSRADSIQMAKGGLASQSTNTEALLKTMFSKITFTEQTSQWGRWTENLADLNSLDQVLPSSYDNTFQLWSCSDILVSVCHQTLRMISTITFLSPASQFAKILEDRYSTCVQAYKRFDGPTSMIWSPLMRALGGQFAMVHIMTRCLILTCDELAFDDYLTEFATIVEIFRFELARLSTSKDGLTVHPFHVSSIPPLYLCAAFCREPCLRREALSLLLKHRRREVTLDSYMAAQVAQAKMRIEERGLTVVTSCSDIPAASRICIHDAKYDAGTKSIILRYLYAPYDERTCQIFEERIKFAKEINDIAADNTTMFNELLQVHRLFLKAGTRQAPNGTVEPLMLLDELIHTITQKPNSKTKV